MTEPNQAPRPTLTRPQQRRIDSAGRALSAARIADLAALDAASLILMVESLRGALDDSLTVIREVAA